MNAARDAAQVFDVLALAAGRYGKINMACPLCGPFCKSPVNRRRKVLRIWRHDPGFATYNCVRCGAHGFARDDDIAARNDPKRAAMRADGERREIEELKHRQQRALEIWSESVPTAGTLAERYLVNRRIDVEALPDEIGGALRWHPRCPWEQGHAPCMVALWTDTVTGKPTAIHRTAISPQAERIDRMSYGPARGCVIRLWPDDTVEQGLVIGEGIETTLAAATRIEHRGTLLRPAWAAGDAGHIEDFPVLPGIEALTILVDHDAGGGGQRAASMCAVRWRAAGRKVTRLIPKVIGDFNDIVREVAP